MVFKTILDYLNLNDFNPNDIEDFKPIKPYNYSKVSAFINKFSDRSFRINVDNDGDGAVCAKLFYYLLVDFGVKDVDFVYQITPHKVGQEMVDACLEDNSVAIILDSSSNNIDLMVKLSQQDIPALIIDHHKISIDVSLYNLFEDIVVCTNQLEEPILRDLSCGFYTYLHLFYWYKDHNMDPMKYFDVATLSIMSDVCSMVNPYNRSILKEYINHNDRSYFISVFTNRYTDFTTSLLSMNIAPRLNALFRTESYSLMDKLLKDINLEETLKEVNQLYRTNKSILKAVQKPMETANYGNIVYSEVREYPDDFIIRNYTGLLANKLTSFYTKPAMVICDIGNGTVKGSIRSKYYINLSHILNTISNKLENFGGHELAYGFTAKRENVPHILAEINKYKASPSTQNKLKIDSLLDLDKYNSVLKDIAEYNEFTGNGVEPIGFKYTISTDDTVNQYDNYNEIINKYRICTFIDVEVGDEIYITPKVAISGINFVADVISKNNM